MQTYHNIQGQSSVYFSSPNFTFPSSACSLSLNSIARYFNVSLSNSCLSWNIIEIAWVCTCHIVFPYGRRLDIATKSCSNCLGEGRTSQLSYEDMMSERGSLHNRGGIFNSLSRNIIVDHQPWKVPENSLTKESELRKTVQMHGRGRLKLVKIENKSNI
jgi:hypothetical protein